MKKVLNFGSLNVDYTYQVPHMIIGGETLATRSLDIFLGGKGFNQSVAVAKAGIPLYHAGIIGDDGGGFLDACDKYGIKKDFIRKNPGRGGHTIIQVDENAQNSILLYGGTNRQITKEFVDEVLASFGEGDILLLQNEINCLDYIIDKAYEKKMFIILNPSPYDERLDGCDMSKISCFMVNEIEGGQISGKEDPDEIIEDMLAKFPDAMIVMTLGDKGSVYADSTGKRIEQPIVSVKAVDTTAAGDTFTGYFVAGLLRGMDMKDIMQICAKASSITVSREGASQSIPTWDEVNS